MKQLTTFLFFVFTFPLFLSAQSNYKPGYVVNLKGDTIQGFINYQEWNYNPNSIRFKKNNLAANAENISTTNSTGFGISGYEYYRRYIGEIGQNYLKEDISAGGATSPSKIDTVFLKLITTGKNVALYNYTDGIKTRYFAAEKGRLPEELIFSMFLNPDDFNQPFRLQLNKLAFAYQPQNEGLVKEVKYAYYQSDLKSIAVKLNGSQATDLFSLSEQNKPYKFFVGVGVNTTISKISGNDQLATSKQSSSTFPELNLGADFFFNKNTKKLIFRAGLGFTENKGTYSIDGSTGTPYTIDYNVTQLMISLNTQIVYNIVNKNNFKFYAALGGAANYGSYSNVDHTITYHLTPTTSSISALQPISVENVFFNATSKIGIQLNHKFELYLTYIPSYIFTNYANLSVGSTSYRAGISYLFEK